MILNGFVDFTNPSGGLNVPGGTALLQNVSGLFLQTNGAINGDLQLDPDRSATPTNPTSGSIWYRPLIGVPVYNTNTLSNKNYMLVQPVPIGPWYRQTMSNFAFLNMAYGRQNLNAVTQVSMPFGGRIISMSAALNTPITAGSLTINLRKTSGISTVTVLTMTMTSSNSTVYKNDIGISTTLNYEPTDRFSLQVKGNSMSPTSADLAVTVFAVMWYTD